MPSSPRLLTRREALQRIAVFSAIAAHLDLDGFAEEGVARIGADPDLLRKEIPWPRVLTEAEKLIAASLADLILPEDEHGPAASQLGVVDFLDEWVSAPYEPQARELPVIRAGLAWIDAESMRRWSSPWPKAGADNQAALLDEILQPETSAHKVAYRFFRLFRDRVVGGYYSTPEGWKALGYAGNVPLLDFAGPPAEALTHVGLN
jgi:hypothetical protein